MYDECKEHYIKIILKELESTDDEKYKEYLKRVLKDIK